jgi:hypothetical protein
MRPAALCLLVFAMASVLGRTRPAPAAQVLGCCVTGAPCGPGQDEQTECLLAGGDFVTAASGAACVETVGPQPLTTACTCDTLGDDLSGAALVDALDQSGHCRQLPKGRVCNCPLPLLPTSTPSPTHTPVASFTPVPSPTPAPVGCCQYSGRPQTCRQATLVSCKLPGRPAVFVQNATCSASGVCLIVPPSSTARRPLRVPMTRPHPVRIPLSP